MRNLKLVSGTLTLLSGVSRPALSCAAVVVLQGCATAEMVKASGTAAKDGEVLYALYFGTMGVAVSAIYDVFTLGGLLARDKPESASAAGSQTAASYAAPQPSKSALDSAREELARAERDLSFNRSTQAMLASMGKDTRQLRVQEPFLQQGTISAQEKVDRLSAAEALTSRSKSADIVAPVATAVNAGTGGGACRTTLGHLAPRLPQYDVAEIQQVRTAILNEDLRRASQKAKSMGLSTAAAASQSLQAANNADAQVKNAAGCIRNFATSPEQVIRSLEQGNFKFNGRSISQLNINESCAAQYVVLRYQAVAMRESAVQMACLAGSSQ